MVNAMKRRNELLANLTAKREDQSEPKGSKRTFAEQEELNSVKDGRISRLGDDLEKYEGKMRALEQAPGFDVKAPPESYRMFKRIFLRTKKELNTLLDGDDEENVDLNA